MKNPDPPADRSTPAEPERFDAGATQQIDVVDLDEVILSAEAATSSGPSKMPPLPAMPPLPPGAPVAAAPSSIAPPAPSAPAGSSARSPMFYVGVLVGVLVLSAAVGTVVALSRPRAAPATAAVPSGSAASAPKVITIGTIEMDDNPDSGP